MSEVEAQLARLDSLSADQLRSRWRALTGTPAPRLSPAMLRLALAWELQAKAYGRLSRAAVRTLDQLAAPEARLALLRLSGLNCGHQRFVAFNVGCLFRSRPNETMISASL